MNSIYEIRTKCLTYARCKYYNANMKEKENICIADYCFNNNEGKCKLLEKVKNKGNGCKHFSIIDPNKGEILLI